MALTHLVLLAHGSPRPEAAAALDHLAARVAERVGGPVTVAFLDHAAPDLAEAVTLAALEGADEVVVVPLLLSDAFHAGLDVPEAVASARTQSPQVQVQLARPLGSDAALRDAAVEVLGDAGVQIASLPRAEAGWGIVLVAAGTSDAVARAALQDLSAVAPLGGRAPALTAFATGGGTSVVEAVAALRSSGCPHVAVVPLVVAPGVISDRVAVQARDAGADLVTATLHTTDALVDLVLDRAEASCATIPAGTTPAR